MCMSTLLWLLEVVSTCRAELNSLKVLKKPTSKFHHLKWHLLPIPTVWGFLCHAWQYHLSNCCFVLLLSTCLCVLCYFSHCCFFFFSLYCHVSLFQSLASVLLMESQKAPVLKLSAGHPLLCGGSGFPPLWDAQLPSLCLPEGHGWGGESDWQE